MAYRGPQKLLKRYSKFRQRSSNFPKENKKFQRQILRLASEHPIFQFLSLPSLPYLRPGVTVELVFARSFALINMEEDSPAVSGRWSPLSQSEDFSALLAFRNLSSSETGSEQFEVVCNFETTLRVCFFSAGLTQQHAQRRKGVVDQTVLLCMEIHIGTLLNVKFYYGAISDEQGNKDMV